MSDLQAEINNRVEAFVAEITDLAKQAAREILENSLGSTTRRATGKTNASTRGSRRKSGKRSPDEIQETATSLLEYIRERPGQRMEAIAKAMNTSTKELTLPTKKLLQQNLIRVEGQKRATSYFPSSGRTSSRGRKRSRRKKS